MDESSLHGKKSPEKAVEKGAPNDAAKAVPDALAISSVQNCTMDGGPESPLKELEEGRSHQQAVKDDLVKDSKVTSSDQAMVDPAWRRTDKELDNINNRTEDAPQVDQACKEVHVAKETNKCLEEPSQGSHSEESNNTPTVLTVIDANAGLCTKPSEGKAASIEGTGQAIFQEDTTKGSVPQLKDGSSDLKDAPSTHCIRDQGNSPLGAVECPKTTLSSTNTSIQSAKACLPQDLTTPVQGSKKELQSLVDTSSNTSLPSSKTMQTDTKCVAKVEDTVNNNIQKCLVSCQESSEAATLVECQVKISSEKHSVEDQPKFSGEKVEKMKVNPPPCTVTSALDVGSSQNRSMLLKYLGLQPVQEGGKSSTKDPRADASLVKPKMGVPYLDSFSIMPGMELFNSYSKSNISLNTSPFEVCSDGSRSPDPPLLSETPVVGSSPPHHDYDAMEARMVDRTPRVDSGQEDLIRNFPHPGSQDTKTDLNKKQSGVSGLMPSHDALDSLCHRLAERVEPKIPNKDDTASEGTQLSKSLPLISIKNPNDHNRYGSKFKKFSGTSDVVPCPRCHRTFKHQNQLRGHLRWHINDPINLLPGRWPKNRSGSSGVGSTTCSNSEKLQNKSALKNTKSNSHLNTERQRPPSHLNGGSEDTFPCNLCNKVFRTPLKLRGHMMVHKRKQPKTKNIYWRNKINKRSGHVGKFQCEICSEKFESQMKLNSHLASHNKEVHPRSRGVKRLGSPVSKVGDRADGKIDSGETRPKAVMGKRKGPFTCDICFKTFLSIKALSGHKGIHSTKWKIAVSQHHIGRPVKVKEEPSNGELAENENVGTKTGKVESGNRDEIEHLNDADDSAIKNQGTPVAQRIRLTYFQCIHCYLVFASRHRVRKHLYKVHSIMPPGTESFTEEKVEGCKFCEVFKKRKRGRPKRGENTLVTCPHGKIVVGYNLPINSIRLSRKSRRHPKQAKIEEIEAVSPERVLQQKCSIKLSPVDVDRESNIKQSSKNQQTSENATNQVQNSDNTTTDNMQTSKESMTVAPTATKRRGRPPKAQLKPAHAIQKVRKMIFSVGATKSRRSGSRAMSAIRRRRMGNEISLLGRQHKSGWDSKRQRFIGRPYKCHLCTMAYRSERQLCGHMRSHGIHIFDLSQLPADQRGNSLISNGDVETKSNDEAELDTHQADISTSESKGITAPSPDAPGSETPNGESGVGGICGVCKKEFDSDNMFHQHLLGRFNKKCRQEWMRHTFGLGMRNKVKDQPQDEVDNHNAQEPKDEQNNGNLSVIDKINMESFQGSGIFSNLQQKVSDKIEKVLQREKLVTTCVTSLENDYSEDTLHISSVSSQDDPGLKNVVSPKKGSVLNEVINRLTQSSKSDNDISSSASTSSQSTKSGKKTNKGSDKPLFRCNICNKAFDKRQKLSVHAMVHRPKIATVMDHIEIATQRSGSGIGAMPSKGEQQLAVQDKVNDSHSSATVAEPRIPAHLIYSCTECPKRFTSNLKLASHLKMHMKSIMNRSPKRDPNPLNKPQEVIADRILDTTLSDSSPKPMEIGSSTVSKPITDKDSSPQNITAVTGKKMLEKLGPSDQSTENVCTPLNESQTSVETTKEVPTERIVNTNGAKVNADSEQINTSRPRLLLKINPSTLQRRHECQECTQSFKSRKQLAHHQKIHVEEKSSLKPLEGDAVVPSDSFSPAVIEHGQSEHAEQISHSHKPEDAAIAAKVHIGDKEQPCANTAKHDVMEDTTVPAKKTTASHPPEKMVPCKICDKVMKKSQLGGHMRSHTKQLLSRKFSQPENENGIDHYQFSDPALSRNIMDRDIISGVDLYRTKSAQSALKSPVMTTANGKDAYGFCDDADDEPNGIIDDMDDLEEHIQDELSRKQQFMCRICNTMCDNYQQLCQHLKIHVVKNPNFNESAGSPLDDNDRSYSDKPVSKQNPFMENMKEKFARPKVYPCELCGFSFASFRQFRVHITQTHGGKYQYRLLIQQKEAAKAGAFLKEPDTINKTHPHKCDVCGRRFKRLALLIFHLNKLHKGWKQRLCMMNVRSRPRQPTVQKMPTTDEPIAPGANAGVNPADLPFTCELCGKSFRMKVQLCGHMKTHGRVGHSPIKITPLSMKGGKYTLRKSRKPDFRLSDQWITDMDDEQMPFEGPMALQQMLPRPNMLQQPNKMKSPSDSGMYASMYAAKPMTSDIAGARKTLPGLAEHSDHYRMPLSSPEMPMTPPAVDLKIPAAPTPPPPDPSKFITMQMEPVLQQMLHRCLLCHSYFSSQESAVQHCKEVHFKKKNKAFSGLQVQNPSQKHKMISPDHVGISGQKHRTLSVDQGPGNPIAHPHQVVGGVSEMRSHSTMRSPPVLPPRQQMSPSQQQVSPSFRPPVPQGMPCPPSMVPKIPPGMRPTSNQMPGIKPPGMDPANLPPSRFPMNSSHSPMIPYSDTMPKSAPAPSPSAKTISQTPFNEMLYRVETTEGQTRYVCNTCKSTFLHYNFLMSHLADHNHLAYTCLQCGYATYSEKDYQLHCQLHDGQISKKIRRVRPKPPGFSSNLEEKVAPRAVATCHICQRSFVNMTGLKAHMILHSANYNSVSERRNESKRVPKRSFIAPVKSFNEEASSEPLSLVKPREEQTEALDLTVKPVVNTLSDEVLDLSMGSRVIPDTPVMPDPGNLLERMESPALDDSLDMTLNNIPEASAAVSLPDVCQVMQQIDVPDDPTSSPTPPSGDKLSHMRKPKNSIRLVGAIDVDVASLENKYSVVTDLMDTDSDISPDLPLSGGQVSPARSGEGEGDHDGKSPKRARNYKCTMCQYATDFKDSMDRHEQKHRKFRTLACHQCSYRTPEKRLMLRHVLTIHEKQKPYECKLCNYSSAYKHHLKRHHTKRHQRPLLTCSLCEFTTDEVSKLESHIASHPEPKVYKCKMCPMVFNSSKLFKAHKQIVHHKKSKKHKKSKREKNKSSTSVVESSESTTEAKEEEPAVVTPEEPKEPVFKHPCNLCSYKTDDQNELTIHLMKTHFSSQIKEGLGDVCSTAQCPQCGYLTGKDQMKAHMQIHDSGELFNCDQCLFKACSQEEVDEHVQQKHKVKLAPTHICKMCGLRFWNPDDLKKHTEMHLKDTSISVKNPFLCNMCPLKLMNRRDALRHLQLHTDRYPFKCRYCVFSCFTKASIQRHLAIHRQSSKPKALTSIRKNSHKNRVMGTSGSSGSDSDANKTQGKSKSSKFGLIANRLPIYQCRFCNHNFRVAEDWQRHERRHHMIWPD